ncbi:MAG: alpha/beta hydrolase [Acidimicrobiales bacterium]
MPIRLFLHGVPETAAVWDELAPAVSGDVHRLSLPGFGTPVPAGFDRSMHAYADWLVEQIASFGEPVDLVGHDWGGILTARIATLSPPGLRSWVTDAPGALRPEFRWHDLAQLWITPGAGEEFFEGMMADRAGSAELLGAYGLSPEHARSIVDAVDQTMADSILALYRSSDGLGTEWVATGPSDTPGLVVACADDPLGSVPVAESMATLMGAGLTVLETGGHFWPLEAAAPAAAALDAFWAGLDA